MSSASSLLSSRTVLVTGANQGIGLAIVRGLLKDSTQRRSHVFLGCRDESKGREAIESLKSEGINTENAEVVKIDISSSESINSLVESFRSRFGSQQFLDALINNAGIATKGPQFDEDVARNTSATNYIGTRNLTLALIPFLRPGASIVNVSSVMGKRALGMMSEENKNLFMNDNLTVSELDALMEKFYLAARNGTCGAEGFPESGYGMSKAALLMWTRILARQLTNGEIRANDGITANAICPGYCKTSMTSFNGINSPDSGAETPIKVANLQGDERVNGTFWASNEQITWV